MRKRRRFTKADLDRKLKRCKHEATIKDKTGRWCCICEAPLGWIAMLNAKEGYRPFGNLRQTDD